MTISERLFKLLDEVPGKSPAGLCRILDIGTSQTTSWKKRNSDPPAKYLPQICEYLGVSISFLITGEDEKIDLTKVLSDDEAVILERYRSLDADGKEVVRVTALQEQRRIAAEK